MSDSPATPPRRAALFVDGDNLPSSSAGAILAAAGRIGQLDLRRAYAAEGATKGWSAVPGMRAILVAGAKNGTDLALSIDAVEAACSGALSAFASDDRDFTHLAHWLRERGHYVLGIGTAKSPDGWRASCSEFAVVASPMAEPPAPSAARKLDPLDAKLRDLIVGEGDTTGLALGALGARMNVLHKITLTTIKAASWRAYLAGKSDLFALDPKGPEARLRWKGG